MAQGLEQRTGQFASPAFPGEGIVTWGQLTGMHPDDPYVAGPQIGGFQPEQLSGTGLVHMSASDTPAEHSGVRHWSELLNPQSPLPFLALLAILYFGLVHLQVAARVGR